MTKTITPADLDSAVYKFGGYNEAKDDTSLEAKAQPSLDYTSSGIGASNNPKPVSGKSLPDPKNEHFVLDFNPLSFDPELERKLGAEDVPGAWGLPVAEDVPVYKLKLLRTGAPDTNKIVFLPFKEKNITSTTIPTSEASVRYFITDQLCGSSFYVDQLKDGTLVCYHANANQESTTAQSRKQKRDSLAAAQIAMDKQYRNARDPDAKNLVTLLPAEYYAKSNQAVKDSDKEKGRTESAFRGAANVMGFCIGGRWEFWYNTSGKITYQKVTCLLNRPRVQVGVDKVPLEIIGKCQRLWPK